MYNIFHTQGIQNMQLYKNQECIRSILLLDYANKAYSFQIVGQIGSQITPEDRRMVKGLGRPYRSSLSKEDER